MNPSVFVRAQVPGSDLDKDISYHKSFYDFLESLPACTEQTGIVVTL
jgi:hypothetical protein